MNYQISGTIAQYVTLEPDRGEIIWSSNGSLMSYSKGVNWKLAVPGGLSGAVRRSLSGEGISLTQISATAPQQEVKLSANSPGHVIPWTIENNAVITTRGSFLAAWGDIDITVTVARRAGAAFFGGAGLFLQKIQGTGTVLVHGRGDLEERDLKGGEQLLVSTGNLAAFSADVDYDIEAVGSVRKFFFAGEGLFMTRVSGPGKVILQSLKPMLTTKAS